MRYQFTFFSLDPAEAAVPQGENFSPVTQDLLMQLRMLCDSVLHTYLSKLADTAEKRNYLHALYTAVDGSRLGGCLEEPLHQIVQILEIYPPTFQPWEDCRLLSIATNNLFTDFNPSITNYLRDFVQNPDRSRSFYCDPELWGTLVVTRCMRYLRTKYNPM